MGKRHWIAGVIKHPGAVKRAAKRHGLSVSKEIRKERKSKSARIRDRANLAMTLRKFHHHHRKNGKKR